MATLSAPEASQTNDRHHTHSRFDLDVGRCVPLLAAQPELGLRPKRRDRPHRCDSLGSGPARTDLVVMDKLSAGRLSSVQRIKDKAKSDKVSDAAEPLPAN